MTKTFCDRCGKEINFEKRKFTFGLKRYYSRQILLSKVEGKEEEWHDICNACLASLFKWWSMKENKDE